MVVYFLDKELEEWYQTSKAPKTGRYKKFSRNSRFQVAFGSVIDILYSLSHISEASNISRLHYERLSGNLSGKSSVRILNGSKERLIFTETNAGLEINILELDMSHYGKD